MSAFGVAETATFPFPVRALYDREDGRLRIVVDASPAAVDDLTVEAGATRVRIAIDRGGERYVRVLSPLPSLPADRRLRRRFGEDHRAVYNNGVLTVTLETTAARSVPVRRRRYRYSGR